MALPALLGIVGRLIVKWAPDIALASAALAAERLLDAPRGERRSILEAEGVAPGSAQRILAELEHLELSELAEEDNTEAELLAQLEELDELAPPDQIVEVRHSQAPPTRC